MECIVVKYFAIFDVLSAAGERRRALGLERSFVLGGQQETEKPWTQRSVAAFFGNLPHCVWSSAFLPFAIHERENV
jgi:hypothetical protein